MFTGITKQKDYEKAMRQIDLIAAKNNIAPEVAALKVVKANRPAVEQFVIENGEVPESDLRSLAAQALVIHEYKIWHKVANGVPDYLTAESVVLAEQQDKEDRGAASNFGGDILGSIFKAGRAALDKINEKRTAKGQKPILAGAKGKALLDKIETHAGIESAANAAKNAGKPKKDSAGNVFIDVLSKDVEKNKTKEAVKHYLPYAILIIIAVFILGKHYK